MTASLALSDVERAYLGLGSNLGNPAETIREALRLLDAHPGMRVVQRASLYRTEPVGFFERWPETQPETRDGTDTDSSPPPWFINTAATIDTTLGAHALLEVILDIEQQLGRVRPPAEQPGYRSRTLDIDLLFYGERILRDITLEIPHPRLHERAFVLAPLLELAPDWIHPGLNRTVRELYGALPPQHDVERLEAV
jgi:2-amino-4-hydroxy-6-hydroxymethyldihydropteridine diphosphokinase